MNIPLGNSPNLGTIIQDVQALAAALQPFLIAGSQRSTIAITDLTIISDQANPPDHFTSVAAALEHGTKLFDAFLYFCIPAADRPPVRAAIRGQTPDVRDHSTICRSLFGLFFYLLTRARVPSGAGMVAGSDIPAFLANIIPIGVSGDTLCDRLASFDLGNLDHRWISAIDMTGFGVEALNRFGLGVAGYRMFSPFKLYTCRDEAPLAISAAYELAHNIAIAPPDWDIHPITRSPDLLSRLGPLNANLGNLILECFEDNEIDEMVQNKIIFARPVRDPRARNYLTWNLEMMPVLTNPIFNW